MGIFKSFENPIGDGRHDTEIATMYLVRDLLAAHRINRKGREDQPLTPNDVTRMQLIGKLANGPHRKMVLGMCCEYFPNLIDKLAEPHTKGGNA